MAEDAKRYDAVTEEIRQAASVNPQLSAEKARMLAIGRCTNNSGRKVMVYGPKVISDIEYDNQAYVSRTSWTSPLLWDCDGFFLPQGVTCKAPLQGGGTRILHGPGALKYRDLRHVVITRGSDTDLLVDIEPDNFLGSDDVNWFIPDGRTVTPAWDQARVDQGWPNDAPPS